MNDTKDILQTFRDLKDVSVLQEDPHPVIAPLTVGGVASTVRLAYENKIKVIPIGTGSSFGADFLMRTPHVIAITTNRLKGTTSVSPFCTRVFAGTPPDQLFSSEIKTERRTIGSLIAAARASEDVSLLSLALSAVLKMQVVSGDGSLKEFSGFAAGDKSASNSASFFLGSGGRLGIIASLDFRAPIPLVKLMEDSRQKTALIEGQKLKKKEIMSRSDLESIMDPWGTFSW